MENDLIFLLPRRIRRMIERGKAYIMIGNKNYIKVANKKGKTIHEYKRDKCY